MMEARPAAALIVAEADFLLEVVIIALDAPAQLGDVDKAAERHAPVDCCEPEFGGRGLVLGPFDEQCLFGQACLGRLRANAATLTRGGFGLSSRTGRTLTVDTMAAT